MGRNDAHGILLLHYSAQCNNLGLAAPDDALDFARPGLERGALLWPVVVPL